jgi:hypothetical protein
MHEDQRVKEVQLPAAANSTSEYHEQSYEVTSRKRKEKSTPLFGEICGVNHETTYSPTGLQIMDSTR